MTTKETSVIMEAIRLAYQRTAVMTQADAEKTLALWSAMFADTPYEQVNQAVKSFIMTDTKGFPPTIGQINALITEAKMSNLPSANEAWGLVRKAISNGLYGAKEEFDALPEICQKVVATPSNLYDWANLDHKGLNVVRSTFLARYSDVLADLEYSISLPEKLADNRKALADSQNKVKALAEGIEK